MTFSITLIVIMVLLHIWYWNLKKNLQIKKEKIQISNFYLGASPFENLKFVNKSEILSCSRVPDVGIQNDRI